MSDGLKGFRNILSIIFYDGAQNDRYRGLEGAGFRNGPSGDDEKIEDDAEDGECDDDGGNRAADVPEIPSQRVPKKEKRTLHDQR
jgi:hypothetical protein